MLALIRFALAITVLMVGFNISARLQVIDDAQVFVKNGTAHYRGRVSRSVVTGAYEIQTRNDGTVILSESEVSGLAYEPLNGLSLASMSAGIATLCLLMLIMWSDMGKKSEAMQREGV